ncbi:MAG: hypothetical protein OXU24_00025 [Gammaproteobacteria bacterium]|nr:hypothetical protein [Gammaproteobacteria bacterium]
MSLASHVRKMVTVFLFVEFDERRSADGNVSRRSGNRANLRNQLI